MSSKGKLYLIPVTLSDTPVTQVIPQYNIELLNSINHYVVEEGKSARRFLKAAGILKPLQELNYYELNEHTQPLEKAELLKPLLQGENVGLMSEAGCPGIADPGAELVKMAHVKNIDVIPLVGPSSIFMALMASGFNGQNFCFNGYLPKEKSTRIAKIKELERAAYSKSQTQIFIETPYRNQSLFEELLATLNPNTQLQIANNITGSTEFIKSKTIEDWKKMKSGMKKEPCIFSIYKA